MRKDMHKLLCERPRKVDSWGGPGDRRTYIRSRDKSVHVEEFLEIDEESGEENYILEEVDDKVSRPRTPMTRSAKVLSDYLAPLEGWLIKQVNKPWDKVFSEISAMMPDGVHADHIRGHIKGYVETNVMFVDNAPYSKPLYGPPRPISKSEMYVDPNDGILKWGKGNSYSRGIRPGVPKIKYSRKTDPNIIKLEDGNQYQKIDGIWYFCEKIGEQKIYSYRNNFAFEPIFSKRQLSKKELKKLGLENDIG